MKQEVGHKLFLITIFATLFLILPLVNVSAAPPVTTVQQFTDGLVIEDTPQTILKQNQDFKYNFFVYNLSNGLLISNSSTTCIHYIADSFGNVIFMNNVTYFTADKHWGITIPKANFETAGTYAYGTQCQSELLGGAITGLWEVTPSGETNLSVFYFLFIILVFGFVVFGVWKEDITITMLGTFGLYFIGLYVMFYGIDTYKNIFTQSLSVIILAVAGYISIKLGLESMN